MDCENLGPLKFFRVIFMKKKLYLQPEHKNYNTMETDMMTMLAKCVLPEEIVDNFDIVSIDNRNEYIDIYLDEKEIRPEGHKEGGVRPNGFTETAEFNDFPARGKKVMLHIRRRRWLTVPEGKSMTRPIKIAADGTRITKGFADFLKEPDGYMSYISQVADKTLWH